jgi:hypothetical protein
MMSEEVENTDVKEALQARAFVSNKMLSTIDECFKMIGERPLHYLIRLRNYLKTPKFPRSHSIFSPGVSIIPGKFRVIG